jgi:RNA polymerase sigma-70 factor (ECF subfamily)
MRPYRSAYCWKVKVLALRAIPSGTRRRPVPSNVTRTQASEETIMNSAGALRTQSEPDERHLVQLAAGGDPDALALIMRRHNRMMYRAARSILKSDVEAEDAVQDAYVRAFRALKDFRGEAGLGTWLTRIAVNEALGRLRERRREHNVIAFDGSMDDASVQHSATQPEERDADDPEHTAMRGQARALLERQIDRRPAAFRSVFVLRALEDMSVDEVASALDLPAATVRTRYFRARALLREALEREFDLASCEAFGFAGSRCDRIVAAVLARMQGAPADGPPG